MTIVERLVERLRDEGVPITDGWVFHRTYAGRVQRECGAWSWWIDYRDAATGRPREIGGYAPVSELVRAAGLTVGHELGQDHGTLSVDPI